MLARAPSNETVESATLTKSGSADGANSKTYRGPLSHGFAFASSVTFSALREKRTTSKERRVVQLATLSDASTPVLPSRTEASHSSTRFVTPCSPHTTTPCWRSTSRRGVRSIGYANLYSATRGVAVISAVTPSVGRTTEYNPGEAFSLALSNGSFSRGAMDSRVNGRSRTSPRSAHPEPLMCDEENPNSSVSECW